MKQEQNMETMFPRRGGGRGEGRGMRDEGREKREERREVGDQVIR